MSLNFVLAVLHGTPVWVFVVFAVLLSVSVQLLRPNVRSLRRILLLPVFFTGWGLLGLFGRSVSTGAIAGSWLLAAAFGAFLAVLVDLPMKVDRARRLVWQPGSVVSLLRNTVLFFGHYVLQVAAAVRPQDRAVLEVCDIAVSGLGAGYFVAWGIRFAQRYAAAPEMDLGDTAPGEAVSVR